MFVIIVGCGSLGGHLANELSRDGQDIIVIDKNEDAFKELTAEFSGFRMLADATEADVLVAARIEDADTVVACTEDDNVNLMIAQIAKKIYRVPFVKARVFNPSRQGVYADLGIETICPTILSAMQFKQEILAVDPKESKEN